MSLHRNHRIIFLIGLQINLLIAGCSVKAVTGLHIYGLIVNKTRAALSPANVNKLVCLNNWLDL